MFHSNFDWNSSYPQKRELFHNKEDKLITLVSREVDHPKYDEVEKGLVRVENYRSVTVITYEDFDKPGFTSMFTYHDNVSKILPSGIVFFVSQRLENSIKDINSNFSLASELQMRYKFSTKNLAVLKLSDFFKNTSKSVYKMECFKRIS